MSGNLKKIVITTKCLEEPLLSFANGGIHAVPHMGISLFGPKSLGTDRHKKEIRVGFIGMPNTVAKLKVFLSEIERGIYDPVDQTVLPFPGTSQEHGYYFSIVDAGFEKITQQEYSDAISIHKKLDCFQTFIELYAQKMEILLDCYNVDCVFITIDHEVVAATGKVNDFDELSGKKVYKNFRRALKARLMTFKKPIQIVQESTLSPEKFKRNVQTKANIAWNMINSLYFKAGGVPWGPIGLLPNSCFIGLSFFHPAGSKSDIRASVAQAFDENGDGLILRGQKFKWNQEIGKSPHLPKDLAEQLIAEVLDRYKKERKTAPTRLVMHKSSRFDKDERDGFLTAIKGINQYDLVSISNSGNFRLFRKGAMPPLRGTVMEICKQFFLYATGYIPAIEKYPHGHVPAPLQITDHIGDTTDEKLLEEILILTKMNWNCTNIDGLMPITLDFARGVGDILREVPESQVPEAQYTYYM